MNTKTLILNTAEKLFAQYGFDAVSVRDIVKEANVNIAAIHYHFGNKQELVFAVIFRRVAEVNQMRLDRLNSLKAQNQTIPPEDLIKAFIEPAFKLGREDQKNGSSFMQVFGRAIFGANPELKEKTISLFENVVGKFLAELIKSLPDIKPETTANRFYFAIGSMAHMLMNQDLPARICREINVEMDLETAEKELIQFILGGLNA